MDSSLNITQCDAIEYDSQDIATVNSSTLTALDIFSNGESRCLFSLLNHCRTAQGEKLLASWLRNPLMDAAAIQSRLSVVDDFVQSHSLRKYFSDDFLKRFTDCDKISHKIARGTANLEDCYKLYSCLERCPEAIKRLEEFDSQYLHSIAENLQQLVDDFSGFIKMVEEVVDLEAVETKNEFLVRESYDPSLPKIGQKIAALEVEIEREGERMAFKLDLDNKKTVKVENTQHHGMIFRIPRKEERSLRGRTDLKILDTTKAGIRFENCRLRELCDQLTDATNAYKEQQAVIVNQITSVSCEYCDLISQLSTCVSRIDVLVSFAVASVCHSLVRPTVLPSESGILELRDVRHPLVGGLDYVVNSCNLRKDGEHFIVVTGPNMGGKSTYIKSLAIAVLMCQIGCFVACTRAQVSICSGIYARVGANDNESSGVSTFMAEMVETASILNSADCFSLVIIDELGRGTSTVDGLGLAWGISQHIATQIGCFCLFATHFHELAGLRTVCGDCIGLFQAAALVEEDTFTLLYQIVPGVSDKSFGVEVAVATGFPKIVVEEARRAVLEYESEGICGDECPDKTEGEDLMDEFILTCYNLMESGDTTGEMFSSAKRKLLQCGNSYVSKVTKDYL